MLPFARIRNACLQAAPFCDCVRTGAQVLHTQPFWMAMTRCSCTVLHCGQAGLAARRAQLAVEMEANRMHFDTEWINVFSEAAWQAGRAAATPPAAAPAPAPSEGWANPASASSEPAAENPKVKSTGLAQKLANLETLIGISTRTAWPA